MKIIFTQILICLVAISFAKEPKALIWKITKSDIKQTSYLMGTIHISDSDVLDFFNKYRTSTFDSCELVALEINLDAAVFEGIFEMLVASPDYQITDYLSNEDYEKLSAWLKNEHGMKLSRFEKIKPIFFYFLINDFGPGSNDQVFLDAYIYNLAKETNKEQVGLERAIDQVSAFDDIPYKDQFDLLLASLDSKKQNTKAYNKLLKAYLKQDLAKLEKNLSGEMPHSFYEKLIKNRNLNMLEAMLPLIDEKSTFVAVGAGHLIGEDGLIQLLRNKGYKLTPVSN